MFYFKRTIATWFQPSAAMWEASPTLPDLLIFFLEKSESGFLSRCAGFSSVGEQNSSAD